MNCKDKLVQQLNVAVRMVNNYIIIFFFFVVHIFISLLLILQSSGSLRVPRFKSDQGEIWQECSSRKYTSVKGSI